MMPQKERIERETVNWSKGSTGLMITKVALCNQINDTWKKELRSWEQDEISHLHYLLEDIRKNKVAFVIDTDTNTKKTKKKIWKIKCECQLCEKIFDRLRKHHGHESKKIVWSPVSEDPSSEKSKLFLEKVQQVSKCNYVEYFNERCYICKRINCPFERNRNGVPLFEEKKRGPIDEYYWEIANMYMYRGTERSRSLSKGPEDTDSSLIFKMMKNCQLYQLDDDESDEIYDDLLEVRNILMHSAEQRLSDEALEICFTRMETLLKAERFSDDEYCRLAISELSVLKDAVIIMSSMSSQDAKLIRQAFTEQHQALQFDINVQGSLQIGYHLEGILKINKLKMDSGKYCEGAKLKSTNEARDPAQKTSDKTDGSTKVVAGAAGGALSGTTLGSVGGAVGAAYEAVFGDFFWSFLRR